MVKLLKAEFDIFALRKTQRGPWVDYKGCEREPGQRHSNEKYQKPDRTKDNIFLKPKMTERMASGWMTIWRLTGELKRFGKDAVKDGGNNSTTGAISPGKRRNANQALKEAYEELKGNVAKRISFRSDPRRRRQRPISV